MKPIRLASFVNLFIGVLFVIAAIHCGSTFWPENRVAFDVREFNDVVRTKNESAIKAELVSALNRASEFEFDTQRIAAGTVLLGLSIPLLHFVTMRKSYWGAEQVRRKDVYYAVCLLLLGSLFALTAVLIAAFHSHTLFELKSATLDQASVLNFVDQANHMVARGMIAIKGIALFFAGFALFAFYMHFPISTQEKAVPA
jgi:NO-binding membrane sensor protein with MHYT domain